MAKRRLDSLLGRLLLAQGALLACATLIFFALLVVERNRLLGPPYAALWAPQAIVALRAPQPAPLPVYWLTSGLRRHETLPPGFKPRVIFMPAARDFVRELAGQGIAVDDIRVGSEDGHLVLWVQAHLPGLAPVWLSGYGPSAVPAWSRLMTVGMLLLCGVIGVVSWTFARRVTRPLAQLRQHMQAHARSGQQPGDTLPPLRGSGAPPELVEIDEAYRQLAEKLQRNERERALLLAGVSHDLRSPLSRIRLAAEMLPESTATAAGVASITRNVDHADRLTASFLEFVRTGAVDLDETVDLAAVTREAVARFERPSHELAAHVVQGLLLQRAHGLLVERLIVNLVDNALKHGGTPVHVELVRDGDAAVLTVSDAGPGLPQGGAGRLMEAFARGDASRGLPGFGLGLAIAQQIVVRLQGELVFAQQGARHLVRARLPMQR